MGYPIEKTVHPMSQARGGRIDIFYGGNQHYATSDMMLMLEQSVPGLEKDDHILLLNTLSVHKVLASAADKLSKGHQGKILVYSASGTMLREKLDFLSKLIVAKQIKMIVLNSWEFAACGSRQRHALAQWLREMRDANEVRIVVYSMEENCPDVGALSMLAFTANSNDKMGEWRWHNKYTRGEFYPNATETVSQYMSDRAAKEPVAKEEPAIAPQTGGMTMPRKKRYGSLDITGPAEIIEMLKNKDLDSVGAHAMAA